MPDLLALDQDVRIADGISIPWLGLGTYMARGDAVYRAVIEALEAGYRHIDTAAFYDNEADIGRAIRDSGLPRERIFVTTKLWNSDQARPQEAFARSRDRLDVGPIDLYLLHWPVPEHRIAAWGALEELLAAGECRAIGVSNFTRSHLEELLAAASVPPAVNQVEMSPFLYQRELIDYCHQRDIRIEAYSPLTKGRKLQDPRLVAIADGVGKTPAQVLIRWCLQKELVVLPKSQSPARIRENAAVTDWSLDPDTMRELDALDERFRSSWDPTTEA